MSRDSERRDYYRIDDVLPLFHSVAPPVGDAAEVSGAPDPFVAIDAELGGAINHSFRDDPVTGQALGLLNRKLDLIRSLLPGQGGRPLSRHEPTAVNLSGSGIAFDCREWIPVGARRRISLLLEPAQLAVELDGTIQESEDSGNPAMPCRIRVAFDPDDFAQEQIIRYVVRRQGARRAAEKAGETGLGTQDHSDGHP